MTKLLSLADRRGAVALQSIGNIVTRLGSLLTYTSRPDNDAGYDGVAQDLEDVARRLRDGEPPTGLSLRDMRLVKKTIEAYHSLQAKQLRALELVKQVEAEQESMSLGDTPFEETLPVDIVVTHEAVVAEINDEMASRGRPI